MKKSDFYFDLPEELIAQTPLERRDASRLMTLDRKTGEVTHRHFYDLLELLQPGDCLVMNNSRVLPARLLGHRVPTGGAVEVLLLKDQGNGIWECLTKPGRKTHTGTELSFGDGDLTATVVGERDDGNKLVQFHYEGIFLELLERLGKMPRLDKVHRSLIFRPDAGIALRAPAAIGAVAARLTVTTGRTIAISLAVFDRVISRVDLIHFFRRARVVRIQVRMIFFGQAAIRRLDLLFARVS